MSDLISRSEVNDVIDELEVYTCGRPNTMKVEVSVLQLQRFINKLKNIPTAYDVDNVISQLGDYGNEEINYYRNTPYENCIRECVSKAIEIVKQGSVPDDVCEWHCDAYGRWHTECHILADNDPLEYTYCPYCGKKILCKE